ncbi:MAG: CehA/McbA family metallohydrolase [Candidatus Heimdallarchaeota archaeon]
MHVDLHVHTNVSFDSKIKIGILLRKMKGIGLEGIAITDHDSNVGNVKARELAKKYDVKVFSGVEITTDSGHILAYGVYEKPPFRKSIAVTIDWIHDQGGIAVCAHPFRKSSPSLEEKVYDHKFDAIEINGRCRESINKAAELAAYTEFFDDITNDDELIKAIKAGQCEAKYKSPTIIKAELIAPISAEELSIMDMIKEKKEPILPIIQTTAGQKAQFFDSQPSESK